MAGESGTISWHTFDIADGDLMELMLDGGKIRL